ncbi:DUF1697 domain-containing protein [Namhaeicola litoreus]|uniref:DUF1697 domain-containing protein n=1 Tax=Namhaeicola litoreus TaxID=1052145 RepID=A0ABW3Y378_9FLAO
MLKKYICLLRAVNVGGNNLLPMKDLRAELTKAGFRNVQTYLQSGNLILEDRRELNDVNGCITNLIKNKFNLDIICFTYVNGNFKSFFKSNPFSDVSLDHKKIYFSFLETKPDQDLLDEFLNFDFQGEKFRYKEGILYCYYENGYGKSRMNGSSIEKKLKVSCTTRNFNTVQKLASS